MFLGLGKAFVRKFSSGKKTKPITMVILLFHGEMESLQDESLHSLNLIELDKGHITITVEKVLKTEEFVGHTADQIARMM